MVAIFKTLCLFIATASIAIGGEWGTDWEAAKAQAKKENKPIFINFTGTDWCGWCIKLENEVFSKKAFQEYAKENLVLMEVDFPRKKKLSDEVKAQNKMLDKKYGVEGYPTLYLLDAEGNKISGDVGYREGGPEAYVNYLKELLAKAEPAA
ncbi:thioredoxin family protein [Haloferula sp.]|uniref:thioredoxin family protein n=1 Tax=Haloferula sp. TaxID=2497595 RepID=UPI003C76F284